MHASEAVIRRHLASLVAGDVAGALHDYAPHGRIVYPGRNRLSGTHRGREAIADFLGLALELTEGSFRPEVHDVVAGDEHSVALVKCRASRAGRAYGWIAADVYHVDGDQITDHWVLEGDQHTVDELFA